MEGSRCSFAQSSAAAILSRDGECMSNRLDTLVARNLGGSSSLQARTPSLFEPASLQSGPALSRPMQTAPDDWPADLPQDLPEEQHSSQSVPPHSQVARAVEP